MDVHSMLMTYRPMSQLSQFFVIPEVESRIATGAIAADTLRASEPVIRGIRAIRVLPSRANYWNVLHASGLPLSNPRRNHSTRWSGVTNDAARYWAPYRDPVDHPRQRQVVDLTGLAGDLRAPSFRGTELPIAGGIGGAILYRPRIRRPERGFGGLNADHVRRHGSRGWTADRVQPLIASAIGVDPCHPPSTAAVVPAPTSLGRGPAINPVRFRTP